MTRIITTTADGDAILEDGGDLFTIDFDLDVMALWDDKKSANLFIDMGRCESEGEVEDCEEDIEDGRYTGGDTERITGTMNDSDEGCDLELIQPY